MISFSSKIKASGFCDLGISDHSIIYCILKLGADKPRLECKDAGSYKDYDSEIFKTELSQLPFHEIYHINDVNDKVEFF